MVKSPDFYDLDMNGMPIGVWISTFYAGKNVENRPKMWKWANSRSKCICRQINKLGVNEYVPTSGGGCWEKMLAHNETNLLFKTPTCINCWAIWTWALVPLISTVISSGIPLLSCIERIALLVRRIYAILDPATPMISSAYDRGTCIVCVTWIR